MSASSRSSMYAVVLKATDSNSAYKFRNVFRFKRNAQQQLKDILRITSTTETILATFELDEPVDIASVQPNELSPLFEHLQLDYLGMKALAHDCEKTFEECDIKAADIGARVTLAFVVQSEPRTLDVINEENDNSDRITALNAIRDSDGPSTGAQLKNLIRTQVRDALEVVYNNRPLDLAPRPVAIYDRILATFRRDLAESTDRLSFLPKELDRAFKVIDTSLAFYPDEEKRLHALNKHFVLSGQRAWDAYELVYSKHRKAIRPGGSFRALGENNIYAYSSIHEGKNDEGEGKCSAISQAQKSYQKTVVSDDEFGLLHLGPQVPKQAGRSDLEEGILETAKYLRALDRAVSALGEYYMGLLMPSQRSQVPALHNEPSLAPGHFPYRNSFTVEGKAHRLEYARHLTPRSVCKTLFAATMESDNKKADVVVKFSYTYCPEAHALLAKQTEAFAPKLFYHEFEEDIQMWMIVMAYTKGQSWHASPSQGAHRALQKAIQVLHLGDFVHGDVRVPNVLVDGDRVQIIDFDWCGRASQVRYPVDMNRDVKEWHSEAKPGCLIEKEHDLHCLNFLLGRK
ncbi:hypothetical protein CYLTODRAFT_493121 [Cylindrobasidium torrendii FP15055 ss-10]|uniref:Protein kinase domain-containing protein n=1 Tax=Cylindrobasidium torrendii FP15055 ss-10 TaxID=1314674 RepID=A0A0D7B2Q7_9AGAR|nr:hypothetical protein CYLTODRAFT_493121 [Cylindrobasidium torrendii FP15055 ss-10]